MMESYQADIDRLTKELLEAAGTAAYQRDVREEFAYKLITVAAELASAKKIINWVIDRMYIVSPELDGQHWWRFDGTTLLGVGPTAMEALLASLPKEKTDATETKAAETH